MRKDIQIKLKTVKRQINHVNMQIYFYHVKNSEILII